jgi:hypothetical protein
MIRPRGPLMLQIMLQASSAEGRPHAVNDQPGLTPCQLAYAGLGRKAVPEALRTDGWDVIHLVQIVGGARSNHGPFGMMN